MSSRVVHNYDDPAAPRACQNCGTPLRGPYCSRCGQPDIDYHRSFHHLTHDLLENLFHFDGKFLVSVAWLLARPGRLTAEFNAGRRVSQVPPLRFYLFVTVLFFLGVQLLNRGHLIDFDRREVDALTQTVEQGVKSAEKLGGSLTPVQRDELARRLREIAASRPLDPTIITETARNVRTQTIPDASAAAAAKTPLVPTAPRRAQTQITIDRSSSLGRTLEKKLASGELTFSQIADELEHRVPTLLFLGMPVFALLLKVFYLRTGRYYIEHLVFSLHLHTWAFLSFMIGSGYFKLAALGPGWLATAFGWAFWCWMLWYLLASFRTVYAQSWTKTALKLVSLGLAYTFALIGMTGLIFGATVAWLAME